MKTLLPGIEPRDRHVCTLRSTSVTHARADDGVLRDVVVQEMPHNVHKETVGIRRQSRADQQERDLSRIRKASRAQA